MVMAGTKKNGLSVYHGFSLIELMVVIAVIAILAAILLPVLVLGKDRALNAQCISNERQWGLLLRLYADDNNGYFMSGRSVVPHEGSHAAWVMSFTNDYQKNPKSLLCPKATERRGPGDREVPTSTDDPNALAWGGPTTAYIFYNISDPVNSAHWLIASYGFNGWLYNPGGPILQGRSTVYNLRTEDIRETSQTPMLADSMWRGAAPMETEPPPALNGEWDAGTNQIWVYALARHAKGVNIVFLDGSVRHSRAKDLWQLPWHKDWNYGTASGLTFPGWMN
jgi:prepilin-type N-terminal cleavage/methylation domain-containing protein/prepilin-type processing-associated H-X9-DG protein